MARKGWFGNSYGHSLAARGLTFKKKGTLRDPLFFAQKQEMELPTTMIRDMLRKDMTFEQMQLELQNKNVDVDPETLRRRAITVSEVMEANGTLSQVETAGVDDIVAMSRENPSFKSDVKEMLENRQQSSLIKPEKKRILQERMGSL